LSEAPVMQLHSLSEAPVLQHMSKG
jgi:hypothetical protein